MTLPVPDWMKSDDLVECRRSISALDVPKYGLLWWKVGLDSKFFTSGGFSLEWRRDPHAGDTYVELLNRGPKNTNSAFTLTTTSCNYGGKRHWFECPRCNRRVLDLYEDNDDFYCRTCLGLQNASRLVNYRSMEPFLRRMTIYNQSEPSGTYQSYKGRPTKRALREEKLRRRIDFGASDAVAMLDTQNRRAR